MRKRFIGKIFQGKNFTRIRVYDRAEPCDHLLVGIVERRTRKTIYAAMSVDDVEAMAVEMAAWVHARRVDQCIELLKPVNAEIVPTSCGTIKGGKIEHKQFDIQQQFLEED